MVARLDHDLPGAVDRASRPTTARGHAAPGSPMARDAGHSKARDRAHPTRRAVAHPSGAGSPRANCPGIGRISGQDRHADGPTDRLSDRATSGPTGRPGGRPSGPARARSDPVSVVPRTSGPDPGPSAARGRGRFRRCRRRTSSAPTRRSSLDGDRSRRSSRRAGGSVDSSSSRIDVTPSNSSFCTRPDFGSPSSRSRADR